MYCIVGHDGFKYLNIKQKYLSLSWTYVLTKKRSYVSKFSNDPVLRFHILTVILSNRFAKLPFNNAVNACVSFQCKK